MGGWFKKSILMAAALLVITCGVYPLTVWIAGQIFFPRQAGGSVIKKDGVVIGSHFIAQNFQRPEYFHPRPSSAGDKGYDGANSSGSNLSMTSKKFMDGLNANIKQALTDNPDLKAGQVPNDMVMGSGSGLDPDITPENAGAQRSRVAEARSVSTAALNELIQQYTEQPDLTLLGEAHVNVLELNLALDNKFPIKK